MTVFENPYLKLDFFPEQKLFIALWTGRLLELSQEEYKELMLKFADLVLEHKPQNILMDTSLASYPLTPSLQDWLVHNIAVKEIEAGVKKVAYLVPADFTTQLGLELTKEKETAHKTGILRLFFDDKEKALKWLNG